MNLEKTRKDFSILDKITYLDSACMSLKPIQVINKIDEYYKEYPACSGRSAHKLSKKVDEEIYKTRKSMQKFINAKSEKEIVFTRNTTESINLVARSLNIKNVLISDREHNSNLLPWMYLHKFKVLKSKDDYTFDMELFKKEVKNVSLVSVVFTSNFDGYSLPIKEIIKISHDNKALVLLDAAQAVPHKEVDVRKLNADFLAFSGHKMLGPTGTGILYAKEGLLGEMKPFLLGGHTVYDSTYKDYKLEKIPERFEAGLQDYAGIIGLQESVKYLNNIGMKNIEEHEAKLKKYLIAELKNMNKINFVGNLNDSGVLSFNIKGMNCHDVAIILDQNNIALRSGSHCCHSWFNAHNLDGSVRASLYLYNNLEDCKILIENLKKISKYF